MTTATNSTMKATLATLKDAIRARGFFLLDEVQHENRTMEYYLSNGYYGETLDIEVWGKHHGGFVICLRTESRKDMATPLFTVDQITDACKGFEGVKISKQGNSSVKTMIGDNRNAKKCLTLEQAIALFDRLGNKAIDLDDCTISKKELLDMGFSAEVIGLTDEAVAV